MSSWLRIAIALVALLVGCEVVHAVEDDPSFQHDVRPILSEHCFRCHGFDEQARKGQLRLDQFEGATRLAESGAAAIVPARPEQSELLRRITSGDPDVRMPPPESGKQLSAAQIETLRRWVASGAKYTQHWAFERPLRRQRSHHAPRDEPNGERSPTGKSARHAERDGDVRDWPHNVIDELVLGRLKRARLRPQAAADSARCPAATGCGHSSGLDHRHGGQGAALSPYNQPGGLRLEPAPAAPGSAAALPLSWRQH